MDKTRKYRFSINLILTVLLIIIIPVFAYNSDLEYEVKAGFFKHFSKSFSWPEPDNSKNFTIGVLGESKILQISKRIYEDTKLKNKSVSFVQYSDISNCKDCHILFISKNFKGDLEEVIKFCSKNSILSMGEKDGYGEKGVMINFFITSKGTTAFEINPREIIKAKLEFDLNILNLGTIVGE